MLFAHGFLIQPTRSWNLFVCYLQNSIHKHWTETFPKLMPESAKSSSSC